jgi:hypothetical protein
MLRVNENIRNNVKNVMSKASYWCLPIILSRAIFFLTRAINPNFWDKSRLLNTLEGIGEASIDNVIEKTSIH